MAGGHTIRSEEPIFGLAVQGLVHPDRILTKGGARPGDALVLSKPVGTGIVLAGGTDDDKARATTGMRQLNRFASETLVALERDTHAVTDVTGFGLAGHGWEMAERSAVTLVIETASVPLYPGALAAAEAGTRTGGRRPQPPVPRRPRQLRGRSRARGAGLRPADVRRAAGRGGTRRWSTRSSVSASLASARSSRAPPGSCCAELGETQALPTRNRDGNAP